MTKATGRGRGWRKKAFADLTPSTQKRYGRYGIGPAEHASGLTPHQIDKWIQHQENVYGWVHEEGREYSVTVNGTEHSGELPRGADLVRLIREQREAERAYDSGNMDRAKARWDSRDPSVPEFMYFYHGVFS